MTTYYAAPTASGAADGSSASDPFTLAAANSAVAAGDTVYLADGTYSDEINPSVSGTLGSEITYRASTDRTLSWSLDGITTKAELETYVKTLEAAGAVIVTANFQPEQGYLFVKGVDFNTTKNLRFDIDLIGANADHIVLEDCRSTRAWYQSSGPITNTDHTFRGTSAVTCKRCHFWSPAKISESGQPDLFRPKGGATGIVFDDCAFFYSSHVMIRISGKDNGDHDFNSDYSARDVGKNVLCLNSLFVGWEHPWACVEGGWGFTIGCTFLECSEWDGRGDTSPEATTYYWDDQDISGSWSGSNEAVDAEAIRNWSGPSTHLFATVIGAGSGTLTKSNGCVNALSRHETATDPDAQQWRQIEEINYGFCTFSDNFASLLFGTTDDTAGSETFYSPTMWGCLVDNNHRDGTYNATTTEYQVGGADIAVWMLENGATWKTAGGTVGQAIGCVFGRSGDVIRYTDGTAYTAAEAITEAWTEWPVTNSKSVSDPQLTGKYNVTPLEGSGLIDYVPKLSTMSGAGVSTTAATITNPYFYPVVDGITSSDFDETNQQYSRPCWIGPNGGPYVENTIVANDYSASNNVTLGTAASWSDGDEIWPVDPGSGLADVGAVQTSYEAEPSPGPTPVGNLRLALR
jgi:hypothetical protein